MGPERAILKFWIEIKAYVKVTIFWIFLDAILQNPWNNFCLIFLLKRIDHSILFMAKIAIRIYFRVKSFLGSLTLPLLKKCATNWCENFFLFVIDYSTPDTNIFCCKFCWYLYFTLFPSKYLRINDVYMNFVT